MDDKLNLMIAQGPPKVDFSPLSSLLGDYEKGKQYARQDQAADLFQNGAPTLPDGSPDYNQMAQAYFQIGDHGTGVQLARLAAQNGQLPGFGNVPPAGNVQNSNPPNLYFSAPVAPLQQMQTQIGGGNFGGAGQNFNVTPDGTAMPPQNQANFPSWTDPATNTNYWVRNGSLYRVR